eukprot:6871822-Prymnesium_polylepis.1
MPTWTRRATGIAPAPHTRNRSAPGRDAPRATTRGWPRRSGSSAPRGPSRATLARARPPASGGAGADAALRERRVRKRPIHDAHAVLAGVARAREGVRGVDVEDVGALVACRRAQAHRPTPPPRRICERQLGGLRGERIDLLSQLQLRRVVHLNREVGARLGDLLQRRAVSKIELDATAWRDGVLAHNVCARRQHDR